MTEESSLVDEYEAYIQGWWIALRWTRQAPSASIRTLAEGLVKLKQESGAAGSSRRGDRMSEPTKVSRYRIVGDPQQVEHTLRRFGEFAHQHDDEDPHAHDGGGQFHYHYPGIPPGWEPAFLEG